MDDLTAALAAVNIKPSDEELQFAEDLRSWLGDKEMRSDEEHLPIFQTPGVYAVHMQLCRFACSLVDVQAKELKEDPAMLSTKRRGKNMLLCGIKGVGKTSLCKGVCAYLNEKYSNVRGVYHNFELQPFKLPSDILREELEALDLPADPACSVKELVLVREPIVIRCMFPRLIVCLLCVDRAFIIASPVQRLHAQRACTSSCALTKSRLAT